MVYSETKIVIGGLVHIPVLIFIANFIKGKFGIKTIETKDNVVNEEPVKIIDYLKIKNFNLVSHVPFIRFLEAINWI